MAGIDDFKDLSNAVVDGGQKMKSALSAAVEAAKGLDKILDAVSKQQTKTLQVTKNFRDALKSTAERMEAIKKSTTEANRGLRELKKLFKDTSKEASNFASTAQKDMGILAKQSSNQLKVQKQLFALSKKQTTQSRKFNHEVLDFRDYSKGALKNIKLFNLQLKAGKKLGDAYGKALGDTDIQSTVNIEYDSAGIAKLQAAIVELKKQIEEKPVRFGVDVSKLEEAETLLKELHRLAGKPVEVKMSMAPAPKVMEAAAPAKMAPNQIREYLAAAKPGSWLATPPGAKTVLPPKGKAAAGTGSPFRIQKPKPKPVFPRGGIGKKGSFAAAKAGGIEPSKAINTKAVTEYAKRWDAAAQEIKGAYSTFSLKVRKGTITDPDQIENTAVKLKGLMQQYESFKDIISSLDPVESENLKTTLAATKSLEEQNAVMTSYIKAHDDLLDRYLGEAEAAQEAARADNDLEKAMNSQFSVLNQVRKSMKKGAEEAREFAGGIKTSGGVLVGAGLAAFFLFKKLGELTEKYKDAAVGLKRFNVELEGQAKALYGSVASAAAFKTIRNQLTLTREQAGEFFDVLTSGVTAGVGSVDKLVSAAIQLRETFGGDQTKRLKEYIDLLKEIPTLDTDLSFTATADDRAAALFALAEKGQISTVMELRAAGLAGGMQKPLASKEDVKLLNNAQRTEKFLGDIRDAMLNKFFPTWGPQFAAIADNTFKIFSAISGVIGVMAGTKLLAALGKPGGLLKGLGLGGMAAATSKAAAPAASAATTAATKTATLAAPAVVTGVAGAAGAAAPVEGAALETTTALSKLKSIVKSTGGKFAIAGLALEGVGIAADLLGDHFSSAGDETSASVTKLTAGAFKAAAQIAGMGAVGAWLGTAVFPGLGTAIGAAIGAFVGGIMATSSHFEAMGDRAQTFGKALTDSSKYSKGVVVLGNAMTGLGSFLKSSGKDTGEGLSAVGSGLKKFGASIWNSIVASDAEADRRRDAADDMMEYGKVTSKITVLEKRLAKKREIAEKKQDLAAIEMGKIFGRLNIEANTAKKALGEFNKGLASLQLENLAKLGGSAEQFQSSLDLLTRAATSNFKMQMNAFRESRKDILTNSTLDATSRRDSLQKLSMMEAQAVKEFVDAIDAAVEAIYKSPSLIEAGLKAKMAKTKLDFELEAKVLSPEEKVQEAGRVADTAAQELAETLKAAADAQTTATKKALETNQVTKNLQMDAAKAIAESGDILIKDLASKKDLGVSIVKAKGLTPEDFKGINEAIVGGIKVDKDDLALSTKAFDALPEDIKKKLELVKKVTVSSFEMNAEEIKKNAASTGESLEMVSSDVDKFTKSLKGDNVKNLARQMVALQKATEPSKKALKEAQKVIDVGEGAGLGFSATQVKQANEDAKKYNEELEKNNKETVKLKDGTNDYKDNVIEMLGGVEKGSKAEKALNERLDAYVLALGEENATKESAFKKANLSLQLQGAINRTDDGYLKAQTKLAKAKEEQNALTIRNELLQKAAEEASKATLTPMRAQADAVNKIIEVAKKSLEGIATLGDIDSDAIDDRKRELELINIRAGVDAAAGKGLENRVSAIQTQVKLSQDQTKLLDEMTPEIEKRVNIINKQIAMLEEAWKDTTDKDLKGAIKDAIKIQVGGRKKLQDALKAQEKAQREGFDAITSAATNFQDTMESLAKRPEFKAPMAEIDFSGAQMEAAAFSKDWEKMSRQSLAIAIKAAAERLALEKESINTEAEIKRKAKEREIDLLKKASPADKARMKAELGRTLEANRQFELAKKEVEQKKVVVERAKQSAQLATDMVDAQQQVTDAEAQFLTEVGGNWQSILDLQSQSVQFEKQKADIAEQMVKDLADAGADGLTIAQAQSAARLAELKYQQKALGAQKSAYEALAGMAFGAIRSSAGARKNLDSAVMKMGRKATRVKTSAGLYRGADEKGVTTISQRSIMARLAGVGGVGPGGALAGTPKKMTTEKMVEESLKEAEKTATQTKNTADATGEMRDLGKSHGSLQTSDNASQNWLSKICDYTGVAADTLGDLLRYTSGSSAGKGERKVGKNTLDATRAGVKAARSLSSEVAEGSQTQAADAAKLSEVQKGIENSTRETAGQVREVNSSLIDQLNAAKAELRDANKQLSGLSHDSTSQEIENASAKTTTAMEKVAKIQDQIRVNEMKNPLAGMGNSIDDMAGILHGDISQEMKDAAKSLEEIQKLSASRDATPTKKFEGPRTGDRTKDKFLKDVQVRQEKREKAKEASAKKLIKDSDKTAKVSKKDSSSETKKIRKKMLDSSLRGSKESAKILASGSEAAGMGPGDKKVDWENFRYDIAKAKGEQLNTEAAKGGEAIAEDMRQIREMFSEASKPGSMYTHDISLESAVLGLGKTMETVFSRSAGGVDTAPGQTAAGFAGMGEDTGVGGGGAMKVTGEITVKFDSKMFRTQVAQIVGEVIRTGETRKALSQQGFANKVNGI